MNTNQPSLIGITELLKASLNLYWGNIWILTAIAGIFIPLRVGIGFTLYVLGKIVYSRIKTGSFSLLEGLAIFLGIFLAFVWMAIFAWFRSSLTIAVWEIGSGKVTTIEKALKDGWLIKWSFLLVITLFTLSVIGGTVLLIMPGIIFFVWYFFHPYTLICENLKGRAVLSRSKELVRGYWCTVTFHILVFSAIVAGISFVISFIPVPQVPSHLAFGTNLPILPSPERFIKTLFYQLIALPFSTIYFFVLYENLKIVKEPSSL